MLNYIKLSYIPWLNQSSTSRVWLCLHVCELGLSHNWLCYLIVTCSIVCPVSWSSDGVLSIKYSETNFSEIWIKTEDVFEYERCIWKCLLRNVGHVFSGFSVLMEYPNTFWDLLRSIAYSFVYTLLSLLIISFDIELPQANYSDINQGWPS